MDHTIPTELLYALGEVRVGDVVRVPGRDEWCVVVGLEDAGPDGVRQTGPASIEVTVSTEALRRAMLGEYPDPVLVLCPVAKGSWRRSSGPVERMVKPGRWLAQQPTSELVIGALALQGVDDDESLGAQRAREMLMRDAVKRLERAGRRR